ncbi:MAG: hypothetical protein JXB10_08655 [Pirellulales bacterium]|nr:hypothetical protein [Pirellulales bacterium]
MPLQIDSSHPLARLIQEDRRYPLEAYVFLFEALQFAQQVLGMGADKPSDPPPEEPPEMDVESRGQRHVTGQELCEAIRRYALHQYGFMAKTVLNSWGLRTTADFGEVVYNLIRIGQMRKAPGDSRVDFNDLYDFDQAFRQDYRFSSP